MPQSSLDTTSESAARPRPLPITTEPRRDAAWPPPQAPVDLRRTHVIVIAALALVSAYLVWRAIATITPVSVVLGIVLLALETWSLVTVAMHAVVLWNVDTVQAPPSVSSTAAVVAVVIPTRDESHEILMPALAAATRMRLASEVIVLDDGHRPWLAGMCHELGIDYRTRLRPEGGTAAQVNAALATLDAEFVVILAPDQVADRDLIGRTLAHFVDPSVALVQTPVAYYNENSFEHVRHGRDRLAEGAAFDRVLGAGRNRIDAALWQGGAAVVRRAALGSVGGISTGNLAGGIATTIALQEHGWRTVQHNEVLARGRGAADAGEYARRRAEACAGALQVLRRGRGVRGRGLTVGQRVSHLSVLTDGLGAWRTLGYLLVPAAALLLAMTPAAGPVVAFVLLFPLSVVARHVIHRVLGRGQAPHRERSVFALIRMPAVLRATSALVTGRVPAPPAGRADPRHVPVLLWAVLGVNAAGLVWAGAVTVGVASSHYPYAIVAAGAAAWAAGNVVILARAIGRIRSPHFGGDRRRAHRFDVDGHVYVDGQRVHVLDLSLTGVRALSYADVPDVGSYCALTFTDPSRRPAIVTGTVAGIHRRPHGHELRVELESDQTYVMGAILADALLRPV